MSPLLAMADSLGVLDFEWQCPSCTFINKAGSFKCFVCKTPKGTATRQVKFHTSALEQRYAQESLQSMTKLHSSRMVGARSLQSSTTAGSSGEGGGKRKLRANSKPAGPVVTGSSSAVGWPRLEDIDRNHRQSFEVTVDSITVVITEYVTLYSD